MLERIAKILADYRDINAATITMQTTFADLGLDSLDVVELVMKIEEEFNTTIEVSESLKTVGDIVALIKEKSE